MENNVAAAENVAPVNPAINPVSRPKPGSPLVKILVIIVILLVIILIGIVAFLLGSNKTEVPEITPLAVIKTPAPTIEPTLAPVSSASATPTTKPAITSIPTVAPKVNTNPNLKTFTSDTLGIAFDYLEIQPDNSKDKIVIRQVGNKVFVNFASYSTDGQSVEIFKKDKAESVPQAIKRLFLQGIAEKDCFVKETTDAKKYPQNFTTYIISYPTDPNSDIPEFAQQNICPQGYTQTNGIAYFLGDITHPEQFVFLSIGQYGLYADSGKMWQETIRFL